MDRNNRSSLLLLDARNYWKPRLESELRPSRPLYDLKGIVMNHFFMNFLVKKAISPSNFSRPPPTIAPLPVPSTPASRPLYPRLRTLYP